VKLKRPPLPAAVVDRIRRERLRPHPAQWDYLHLKALRHALEDAFESIPASRGPVLDVYCGTKPYDEMMPWKPNWGLDLDRHFARADLLGSIPLPFRAGAFSVVVCTQAFHLVENLELTVGEMARVLAPGGHVVISVPYMCRRGTPGERKLGARDLLALFEGWTEPRVTPVGGLGSAVVSYPGGLFNGAARRLAPLRTLLPPVGVTLTGIGMGLNALLAPFATRWPDCLILVARRSDS
jgi:SAM-dependent methyltransferase